jgi:hypothetical protein
VPRSQDGKLTVGLVRFVKTKLHTPTPAQDLYTSAVFVGRRAWVEQSCDRWFILSAKHGLVDPEQVLEPYDESLVGKPRSALER